jgi:hypothetical protein
LLAVLPEPLAEVLLALAVAYHRLLDQCVVLVELVALLIVLLAGRVQALAVGLQAHAAIPVPFQENHAEMVVSVPYVKV